MHFIKRFGFIVSCLIRAGMLLIPDCVPLISSSRELTSAWTRTQEIQTLPVEIKPNFNACFAYVTVTLFF